LDAGSERRRSAAQKRKSEAYVDGEAREALGIDVLKRGSTTGSLPWAPAKLSRAPPSPASIGTRGRRPIKTASSASSSARGGSLSGNGGGASPSGRKASAPATSPPSAASKRKGLSGDTPSARTISSHNFPERGTQTLPYFERLKLSLSGKFTQRCLDLQDNVANSRYVLSGTSNTGARLSLRPRPSHPDHPLLAASFRSRVEPASSRR